MATLSKPASRSGRFIKADGRFIKFYQQWPLYQGRGPGQWPQWQFYQSEAAKWPDLLDSGCGWPISYCPAKGVYQRPSRAIFIKGWQSDWPFYQGRPAAVAVLSKPMAVLSRPASINSSFSNSGRFIKARPVAAMAVLSPRSGRMARSLDLRCGWPISYCPVQAVYQRPSRAIFVKSWQSERTASKASYKASYAASYSLKLLRRPGRVACHFSRREESPKVLAWVWPVGLPESSFPSF